MISRLAARLRSDQGDLMKLLRRDLRRLVIPQSDRPALRSLVDVLAVLAGQYNRASASLAADYYAAERAAAGITATRSVPVAAPLPDADVLQALGWATRDLTNDTVDLDAVLDRTDTAASDLALEGGRNTVSAAAEADPQCLGYVRVPRPGACAFCAALGLKRADGKSTYQLYKSAETAQRRGRGATEDAYHDHCQCAVQAVFRGQRYERPEHVERFAEIYADSTRGVSGPKKLAAFRAALAADRAG